MNTQSSTDWPEGAIPKAWVEALFTKMLNSFGGKFADNWRGTNQDAVKREWATQLGKLSREEIKRGVDDLPFTGSEWAPSLPAFIKLCRISVDPLVAYYEAINGLQERERGEVGTWSHPAVYFAAQRVGPFDMRNQTYSQVKPRWEHVLAEEMRKGQWAEIPAPMIALPAPSRAETSSEAAAEQLAKFEEAFRKNDPKFDHKIWARRIMVRHKNGDKSLTMIQISSAKEALKAGDEK